MPRSRAGWSVAYFLNNNHRSVRPTVLAPHLPFLRERWEAGCYNIAQLYRELVARGYTQSYRSVYKQLVRLLPEGKKNATKEGNLSPTPYPPGRRRSSRLSPV